MCGPEIDFTQQCEFAPAGSATKPPPGQELDHFQLREALGDKTEFTQQEWDGFGIRTLSKDHFVKSGENYYKPAKMCPSLWAAFLINGA